MAKAKVNRSQAVLDYLATNPEAPAKEVVKALAANGIKVNDGLVYAVKGGMKEKKRRKARVVKAAKAAAAVGGGNEVGNGVVAKTDALTMIREVKALAQKAGGYAKLKELVDALAE